jgi:hypothetical protein
MINEDNLEVEPDSNGVSLHNKVIINSVEPVKIKEKEFYARIDTGATRSSISKEIADLLSLGPVIDSVDVRNAHGKTSRDVILVDVELAGVKTKAKFNLSDRTQMQYPVLIGRNILKRGFLVDCSDEDRNS